MFRGVCYLFGNQEMPMIHGIVTFREERNHYICVDIDIQGNLGDSMYGIQVGPILFPPISPDTDGNISVTFCRKGEYDDLFSDSAVRLFRYHQRIPDTHTRRQNVAKGKVHQVVSGRKEYHKII